MRHIPDLAWLRTSYDDNQSFKSIGSIHKKIIELKEIIKRYSVHGTTFSAIWLRSKIFSIGIFGTPLSLAF